MWQYITLMKRIYLIDCPGVVPPSGTDTPEDILLRGVVRVENVENPEQYVAAALKKCKERHVLKTYDLKSFENPTDFLEQLARKGGRLLKGGEADVDGVAKMFLNDFLRGKIPWFVPPPQREGEGGVEGKEGEEVPKERTGDLARINRVPVGDLRGSKRKRGAEGDGQEDGEEAVEMEPKVVIPASIEESLEDDEDEEDFDSLSSDEDGDEDGVEGEGEDPDDAIDGGGVSIPPAEDRASAET